MGIKLPFEFQLKVERRGDLELLKFRRTGLRNVPYSLKRARRRGGLGVLAGERRRTGDGVFIYCV